MKHSTECYTDCNTHYMNTDVEELICLLINGKMQNVTIVTHILSI